MKFSITISISIASLASFCKAAFLDSHRRYLLLGGTRTHVSRKYQNNNENHYHAGNKNLSRSFMKTTGPSTIMLKFNEDDHCYDFMEQKRRDLRMLIQMGATLVDQIGDAAVHHRHHEVSLANTNRRSGQMTGATAAEGRIDEHYPDFQSKWNAFVQEQDEILMKALEEARDVDVRYGLCSEQSLAAWAKVDKLYENHQKLQDFCNVHQLNTETLCKLNNAVVAYHEVFEGMLLDTKK